MFANADPYTSLTLTSLSPCPQTKKFPRFHFELPALNTGPVLHKNLPSTFAVAKNKVTKRKTHFLRVLNVSSCRCSK